VVPVGYADQTAVFLRMRTVANAAACKRKPETTRIGLHSGEEHAEAGFLMQPEAAFAGIGFCVPPPLIHPDQLAG